MHVLSAIHQYVAVNIWSGGGFYQRRSPSSTYFCPILDLPLGISGLNHYKMAAFQVKPFCFSSSLWILLALPWIHPRADLITRGPRAFYRSPDNQQQTVQSDKRPKGPLSLTWVQRMIKKNWNGTKNNNTSSHMLLDHCYTFGWLL